MGRTSPPRGGRLAVTKDFANLQRWRLAKPKRPSNLPPCGGDVRQDRGGRRGAQNLTISACSRAVSPVNRPIRVLPARPDKLRHYRGELRTSLSPQTGRGSRWRAAAPAAPCGESTGTKTRR